MTTTLIGQSSGTIGVVGDSDWFKIQLQAGTEYVFDVTGNTLSSPEVAIYDASGNLLTSGTIGGTNGAAQVVYIATTSGTYYVGASSTAASTGTYTTTVSTAAYDYAGNTSTSGQVAVGGQTSGTLSVAGQSDWFQVQLVAGSEYAFTVSSSALSSAVVTLYDSTGKSITSGTDVDTLLSNATAYSVTTSGTYYVGVSDAQDATGSFSVAVASVAYDVAGNTTTSGHVSVGGSTSGTISAVGQSDWYQVQLQSGTQYVFTVNGVTLSTSQVALYDASGHELVLGYSTGSGTSAATSYDPATSGTYYVSASGFLGATGTFTVSVATATDDYAGNINTAGSVSAGSHTTGTIETAGDSDWFKIQLQSGTKYVFTVTDGSLSGSTVALYDASGNLIVSGSGGGTNSSITTYEPTTSGTYYVSASASSLTATGSYTVSVATGSYDAVGNTTTSAQVSVGSHVSGTISSVGQSEWYKVQLVAGTEYVFDVGNGTLAAPSVTLYDASGNALATGTTVGTNGAAETSFTATTTGTYYVGAAASQTTTGTFTLSVATTTDDYAGNTSTTGVITSILTASSAISSYNQGQISQAVEILDSAANVQSNLDTLQTLATAGKISSIVLSDSSTPTLTLTSAQVVQDKGVLSDISSTYTLAVTGYSTAVSLFVQQQSENYLPGTTNATSNEVVGFQSATFTSGSNAVVLDSARSQYLIQVDGTGHLVVENTATSQSINVTDDTYIVFNGASQTTATVYDQLIIIASGSNAANDAVLARMYQATAGRLPDLQGFEGWRAQLDAGNMTTEQIAQYFVTSPEFQTRYGSNTTDLQFVDAIYTNVLGRAPDASGEASWVAWLGSETTAEGATAARAALLVAAASSAEEVSNSASWLVDVTTGGSADSGLLLSAATVVSQAVTDSHLNTGLIDTTTIGTGISTTDFLLTPASSGSGSATLTVLAAAPSETVTLSAGITSLSVQNASSTIIAGSGSDTISIDGASNTIVDLTTLGTATVHVLGGTNTTIYAFTPGSGSAIDVTNGAQTAAISILDGSSTQVTGSSLTFGTATAYVVNVGSIGDGSTAAVVAAINKAYAVADASSEHVTFMGTDSSGNTEFWFFGSTTGEANGVIPASSLTSTADLNGNQLVEANEITHVATLIGVAPSALTAADLA